MHYAPDSIKKLSLLTASFVFFYPRPYCCGRQRRAIFPHPGGNLAVVPAAAHLREERISNTWKKDNAHGHGRRVSPTGWLNVYKTRAKDLSSDHIL